MKSLPPSKQPLIGHATLVPSRARCNRLFATPELEIRKAGKTDAQGKPWHHNMIRCRFRRLRDKVGGDFCVYHLRHSFATTALQSLDPIFAELGMELEGETTVEGPWVDRTVGLNGVRADIATLRTPDDHGKVELTKFHTPPRQSEPSWKTRRRTRWAYAASCSLSTWP